MIVHTVRQLPMNSFRPSLYSELKFDSSNIALIHLKKGRVIIIQNTSFYEYSQVFGYLNNDSTKLNWSVAVLLHEPSIEETEKMSRFDSLNCFRIIASAMQ